MKLYPHMLVLVIIKQITLLSYIRGLQQWYHTLANSPISLSHHVRYFTCRHLGLEPLAGCDRKTGAIAALLRCCATVCGNYLVDFIFGILSTPKALLLPHW